MKIPSSEKLCGTSSHPFSATKDLALPAVWTAASARGGSLQQLAGWMKDAGFAQVDDVKLFPDKYFLAFAKK